MNNCTTFLKAPRGLWQPEIKSSLSKLSWCFTAKHVRLRSTDSSNATFPGSQPSCSQVELISATETWRRCAAGTPSSLAGRWREAVETWCFHSEGFVSSEGKRRGGSGGCGGPSHKSKALSRRNLLCQFFWGCVHSFMFHDLMLPSSHPCKLLVKTWETLHELSGRRRLSQHC